MTGKLHRFGGACSGIITTAALCSQLPQTTNGNMLLVMSGALLGGIGGLLPDIDTPHSIISLKHPIISWVVCKFTEHRMAIHTLIIPMFLAVLTSVLYSIQFDAFVLSASLLSGFVFHLVQDTCTRGGIAWGYPFVKEKYSMRNTYSGAPGDILITIVLIMLQYAFFVQLFMLYDFFK